MITYQHPYQKTTVLAASLALVLLAGSCSANQSDTDIKRSPELAPVELQPTPVPLATKTAPIPISEMQKMDRQEQILFARQDLAESLKLELDEVKLSGATQVKWRSGALGCPKPGMEYTQALVHGVLIMLRVGNTAYRYHGIPTGQPFYCPDSQAEAPYINSSDT